MALVWKELDILFHSSFIFNKYTLFDAFGHHLLSKETETEKRIACLEDKEPLKTQPTESIKAREKVKQ